MNKLPKKESLEPVNLIAISGLIAANIITPLDLKSEDQDWVNNEIKWLFSAADNFLAIYQTVQQIINAENSRLIKKYAGDIIGDRRRKQEMEVITPQIWQQEIERSQPIQVSIPPQAQRQPQSNNRVLNNLNDFTLQSCGRGLTGKIDLISKYHSSLKILQDQEKLQGGAGKGDVYLQNKIKLARMEIVKVLREMAKLIDEAYGIKVTSPDSLVEFLEQ
jgi:hypothetical protein